METGASFSAQQEPPAPWAGGSCCTFTAREVFFPRRSPGKNVIGICSQRSCEFGETGGGPTLRAQSRLRGTRDVQFRGWVRWFAWAGSAPLALRCAVGSLGGCGHLYRSTLARSRDATGVRCAPGCLAGGLDFAVFLFVAFYAVADQDQHLAVGGATLVVGNYVEFIEHGVVYSDG